MENPFVCEKFSDFWRLIAIEFSPIWVNVPFDEDPDHETCPYCGLVGSCMCDMIAEEELDPEGLGLEEDYGYVY
jgi:hypothetical protein